MTFGRRSISGSERLLVFAPIEFVEHIRRPYKDVIVYPSLRSVVGMSFDCYALRCRARTGSLFVGLFIKYVRSRGRPKRTKSYGGGEWSFLMLTYAGVGKNEFIVRR